VTKYAYQARLEECTSHTLRHTFAKNLVDTLHPVGSGGRSAGPREPGCHQKRSRALASPGAHSPTNMTLKTGPCSLCQYGSDGDGTLSKYAVKSKHQGLMSTSVRPNGQELSRQAVDAERPNVNRNAPIPKTYLTKGLDSQVGFSQLFGGPFGRPLHLCFALLCHGGAPSPRRVL
jgi:hypothetical protein